MLNILFIGDIVGQDGLAFALDYIPLLKRDLNTHFCIANGENIDSGKGINKKQAEKLMNSGIDVITGGNHIWQKNSISVLQDSSLNTLRPANYPSDNPGNGFIIKAASNKKIAVLNLQGRSFLPPIDCPFNVGLNLIEEIKKETNLIFLDFHAEATAEKEALAWYLDGKISVMVGTHTHVQTADERILPKGTAYITDVGMTGPADSVIGMDPETAIKRFITQQPRHFKLATRNLRFNGVLVSLNDVSGKAIEIKRLNFSREEYGNSKNS